MVVYTEAAELLFDLADLDWRIRMVCVEGIETEGMRDILQSFRVESFQGYSYAKPLKLEEIVKFESKKVTT